MSAPLIALRLPAPPAGPANPRVIVKLQRLDPLFVLAQSRDGGIGFDRLAASDDADVLVELNQLVATRKRRRPGRHVDAAALPVTPFAGVRSGPVRRDLDDRLLEDDQDVSALVVLQALAAGRHPALADVDGTWRRHVAVAARVGRVLGPRRQTIRRLQPDIAIEHDVGLAGLDRPSRPVMTKLRPLPLRSSVVTVTPTSLLEPLL